MKIFYDHEGSYNEGQRQQRDVARKLLKDSREMLQKFDTTTDNGQDVYNRLLAGVWHLETAVNNTAEEASVQIWLTIQKALEANNK